MVILTHQSFDIYGKLSVLLNRVTVMKTDRRNLTTTCIYRSHDDVIKWIYFPCYWPFVRGIHRSPVNSPHKGQRRGALVFSLICAWINAWVNNREAGDVKRHCAHYDVTVMRFHMSRNTSRQPSGKLAILTVIKTGNYTISRTTQLIWRFFLQIVTKKRDSTYHGHTVMVCVFLYFLAFFKL